MEPRDPNTMAQFLEMMLKPWRDALAQPAAAQENVLKGLMGIYARTDYGSRHGAAGVADITSYRRAFPVITYGDVKPMVAG